MKKISEHFKKYGYEFQLLKRVGNVALYSQTKKEWSNKPMAYGVHIVRKYVNTVTLKKQVWVKGDEYLASTSEFGQFAWSFDALAIAKADFEKLCKKHS